MPSINSNIAALVAHSGLLKANSDLSTRLERLSTGLRINRASDDPTGLAKADRLAAELRGLNAAFDGATRGSAMVAAIDSQLAAIADQLDSLKSLVAEQGDAALLSPEDRQMEIDSALQAIDRIANTATFGGNKLLNGSTDYTLNTWDRTRIAVARVSQADLATGPLNLTFDVTAAPERAALFCPVNTGSFNNTTLVEDVTIEVGGPKGVQTLSFAAGTTMAQMIVAVNQVKDQTGVTALMNTNSGVNVLEFRSSDYGSDQTVTVKKVGNVGPNWFTVGQVGAAPADIDTGLDVKGTINGIPWASRGLQIFFTAPMATLTATLTENWTTNPALSTETLTVRGGGATFQVGPGSTSNDRVSFGVPCVTPSDLGYCVTNTLPSTPLLLEMIGTGQQLAVGVGDPNDAVRVVEAASSEISAIRARLGAIDSTRLQGSLASLQSAIEAASSGQSAIRDADVAAETAALVRAQILSQASISMLGAANTNAESMLKLLSR